MSDSTLYRLTTALEGRYRVDRELGAGGMATVYLAHDLKHERDVAIKVLHPELGAALGSERFLSEIKTTARLQHPHILPLLDSGSAGDGLLYYVMPFMRGETLRDCLERDHQLPLEDALRVTREVGDALAYAHAQGIVHRDIKPENILLQDGHALVADFGIALAVQSAGGARMTQTGLSLGTPSYMSPEQAMGERTVDARSDVYALGAVTYEMLAGEAPFTGPSVQAIVAKVLTERPVALRTVRDTVPPAIEAAVFRALAKLPADRWGSARAFVDALDAPSVLAMSTAGSGAVAAPAPARTRGALALLATALVVCAGAAGWFFGRGGSESAAESSPAPVQLSLDLPLGTHVVAEPMALAMAPDGRSIVAVGVGRDNARRLFLRRLEQVGARAIAGSEGATSPTFSPDGRWIAFVAGGQLRKVPVDGGPVQALAEVGEPSGTAWGSTGQIVISSNGRLGVVPEAGGTLRLLEGTTTPRGSSERYPIALADGRAIIYTLWGGSTIGARIMRRTIEKDAAVSIGLDSNVALGLIDGWIVAGGAGVLRVAPIDDQGTRVLGPARQVLEDVSSWLSIPAAAVSRGGTLAYQPGGGLSDIVVVGSGDTTVVSDTRRAYNEPRVAPNGARIAVTATTRDGTDIWILDRNTKVATRLTTDAQRNARAEWTPDGARVIYRRYGGRLMELGWRRWDGGSPAELLHADAGVDVWEGAVSPDGQWLLYRIGTTGTADMWVRRIQGDTTSRPFARTPFTDHEGRFSPDGKWVAYSSAESGNLQVYVRSFPDDGTRHQVSADGGEQPVWGPDGRSLHYVTQNGGVILRARVALTPGFAVIARDTLLREGYYVPPRNGHATYDVTPDGRLVLIRRAEADRPPVAIVGWGDATRRAMKQ